MPSILNATTSSGLVTSADNSGSLQLATNNGTTAVTIDTSQNVGIGTSSPNDTLEVAGANAFIRVNRTGGEPGVSLRYNNSLTNRGDIAVTSGGAMYFTAGGSTERMRIGSDGNVGIGTTTLSQKLTVAGAGATTIRIQDTTSNTWDITNSSSLSFTRGSSMHMLIDNTGKMFFYSLATGAGTNALRWSTATGQMTYDTSSAKYKDNIRDSVYGLNHVMQMRSAQFEYKDDGRSDVGFIAEELQPIVPELVGLDKDGQADSVSYDRMVSVLVKAVQELNAKVDAQALEIQALKGVA